MIRRNWFRALTEQQLSVRQGHEGVIAAPAGQTAVVTSSESQDFETDRACLVALHVLPNRSLSQRSGSLAKTSTKRSGPS